MNISFIGLGKLGLPLASLLSEAGHKIYGIDKNDDLVSDLREGKIATSEENLQQVFMKAKGGFKTFSTSYKEIFDNTEATIVLVNTQIGLDGYSDVLVREVFKELALNFKSSKNSYHLFILSSTVLPGTINKLIKKLEEETGKTYGGDFGFAYVPDFVKLGSVIEDFRKPEFFLVGSGFKKDYKIVKTIWENIHINDVKKIPVSIEEAEIAKISLNAFIVNKISFANHLSLLCKNIDNVNAKNITDAIGLDSRIGSKFFSPGTPFGGTCFPRDTDAFLRFAKDNNFDADHVSFSNSINDMLYSDLVQQLLPFKRIGILGISFKENTDVVTGSPTLKLIDLLGESNKQIFVYDFNKVNLEKKYTNVTIVKSINECFESTEAIIVMHNDSRFKNLNLEDKKLIDPWGLYE
jgi:UDPglucose 6-dehydrogenase